MIAFLLVVNTITVLSLIISLVLEFKYRSVNWNKK